MAAAALVSCWPAGKIHLIQHRNEASTHWRWGARDVKSEWRKTFFFTIEWVALCVHHLPLKLEWILDAPTTAMMMRCETRIRFPSKTRRRLCFNFISIKCFCRPLPPPSWTSRVPLSQDMTKSSESESFLISLMWASDVYARWIRILNHIFPFSIVCLFNWKEIFDIFTPRSHRITFSSSSLFTLIIFPNAESWDLARVSVFLDNFNVIAWKYYF